MYHSWSVPPRLLSTWKQVTNPTSSRSHSNGFSGGVDTDAFNGPDPLWRDVLRKHEEKPIHCIVGGGDQIYCDPLTKEPEIAPWINESDQDVKAKAPLTPEMRLALDRFFFNWSVTLPSIGIPPALTLYPTRD